MNIRRYGEVLRRRWRIVVGGTLLVVLVTAVGLAFATPTYSSSVQMFVTTPGRGSTQAYEGSLLSAQQVSSYARLANSEQLARDVARQLGLTEKPKDLADRITVEVPTNTVILDVAVTDPDPAQAQRIARALAERLTATVARLETTTSGTSSAVRLTTVDPARLPTKPTSPQPLRDLGLALVLGLALGLGGAFLRELLDSSVRDPKEVADATGLPVLAVIGDDSAWSKEPALWTVHAGGPQEEAIRVLRTNLQFVGTHHESQVFTVTSPLPSEGKTTTATHLASAFAQAGSHVLLIDADLRHPGMAGYSDLGDAPGLTAVLMEGVPLEEAVQEGPGPDLTLLPSGGLPPNPSELLQSSAMVDLLAQARKRYDIVIVDSPPLLSGADAAVLAAHSDGTLLLLRHGKTTQDQLHRAVDRLVAVDANILGSVINRVPRRSELVRDLAHGDKAAAGFSTGHRGMPGGTTKHEARSLA